MTTFISSRFVRASSFFLSTFFLITMPYWAQAEAFKGGLLPSGTEKALFFGVLVFFFGVIFGILSLFTRVGKKDPEAPPSNTGAIIFSVTLLFILVLLCFL